MKIKSWPDQYFSLIVTLQKGYLEDLLCLFMPHNKGEKLTNSKQKFQREKARFHFTLDDVIAGSIVLN